MRNEYTQRLSYRWSQAVEKLPSILLVFNQITCRARGRCGVSERASTIVIPTQSMLYRCYLSVQIY